MPLPAASRPYVRACDGSRTGPKLPAGGSTSTASPGRRSRVAQVENAPPSSRFTATRRGPPAALLQTEYVRRRSAPSTTRRSVRCWPGRKRNSSACSSGTSKVTATLSSVSPSTEATCSTEKPAVVRSDP